MATAGTSWWHDSLTSTSKRDSFESNLANWSIDVWFEFESSSINQFSEGSSRSLKDFFLGSLKTGIFRMVKISEGSSKIPRAFFLWDSWRFFWGIFEDCGIFSDSFDGLKRSQTAEPNSTMGFLVLDLKDYWDASRCSEDDLRWSEDALRYFKMLLRRSKMF